MPESKIFPNQNFITMEKHKTKNLRSLQENNIHDYPFYYVITAN